MTVLIYHDERKVSMFPSNVCESSYLKPREGIRIHGPRGNTDILNEMFVCIVRCEWRIFAPLRNQTCLAAPVVCLGWPGGATPLPELVDVLRVITDYARCVGEHI